MLSLKILERSIQIIHEKVSDTREINTLISINNKIIGLMHYSPIIKFIRQVALCCRYILKAKIDKGRDVLKNACKKFQTVPFFSHGFKFIMLVKLYMIYRLEFYCKHQHHIFETYEKVESFWDENLAGLFLGSNSTSQNEEGRNDGSFKLKDAICTFETNVSAWEIYNLNLPVE